MAKSALRIRFVFDPQDGGELLELRRRQSGGQRFAQAMIENFAFSYAEDSFREMAGRLEVQLRRDIMRELRHMAALFQRHIIGAAPSSSHPAGYLDTVAPSWEGVYDRVAIRASVPAWAARSHQYLRDKKRVIGHQRWWESHGTLAKAMTTDNWISSFGPIHVEFRRSHKAQLTTPNTAAPGQRSTARNNYATVFGGTNNGHVKVVVGTVRVVALTNITPQMLPALRSGDPTTLNSDRGNDSLMLMVQAGMGDDVAYRLGRLSSKESGMRYRPTLEPFLAFFLTRAVPNAIADRISSGRLGSLRSSAGRNR